MNAVMSMTLAVIGVLLLRACASLNFRAGAPFPHRRGLFWGPHNIAIGRTERPNEPH